MKARRAGCARRRARPQDGAEATGKCPLSRHTFGSDTQTQRGGRDQPGLLRLVDVISPPPPDDYTITAEYVASPSEDPEFKDLWIGTIRSQPLAMRIVAPPATRAAVDRVR